MRHFSKKVTSDGLTFDSKAEHRRYVELRLLERSGEIRDLTVHPKYELQPGFNYRGGRVRSITLTPDFRYYDLRLREWVVEDVKPHRKDGKPVLSEDFVLKQKLFLYRFPSVRFDIVNA
jgi:hypothetical protein